VMLHAGGRNPYGQHFSHALSCVPWLEYFVRGAPGVPLEETIDVPEQKIPKDGWMELDDRPGFGLGIQESWLSPY
jgi:L-alanine-DL-glutamate epimerase-like enolase superfamily enzyme